MRSVALVVLAVLGIPQVSFGQQLTTPRLALRIPVAVDSVALDSAVAADYSGAAVTSPARGDDVNAAAAAAPGKRTLIGAGVGFVVGAGATWAILNTGGSTAPCNRDANQDAMSAGECAGITVLGGATGALAGALIAHLF